MQASTEDLLCFFLCTWECFFFLFLSPTARGSGVDSGVVSGVYLHSVSIVCACRDGRVVGVVNLSPGVTGTTEASLCRTVLAFERGLRLRSTGGAASRGGRGSESTLTPRGGRGSESTLTPRGGRGSESTLTPRRDCRNQHMQYYYLDL